MIKHIIIENEREVDIVYSEEQLKYRLSHGWKVVVDCSDLGWPQALDEAHKRAKFSGKKCISPKPVSEQERKRKLYQVYKSLLDLGSITDLESSIRENQKKL
jgi:hypothetical protein